MRRFDPDRDKKLVFVTVFDGRASTKVRGELMRPNGQRHGVFSYEMNARNDSPWQSKSWWWAMSGLSFYQGEWQLRLWVDDQPMGRYYFMLGKQPPSVVAGWMEDAGTGCRVWNEVPQPDETVTWSGSCGSDGVAAGFGIREFRYGSKVSRYEGELVNGRMHGSGVRTWPNGSRHQGQWRDDRANGQGIRVWSTGSRYEGEWRDNLAHGPGVLTTANGERFDGTWVDGCFRDGNRRAVAGRALSECQ